MKVVTISSMCWPLLELHSWLQKFILRPFLHKKGRVEVFELQDPNLAFCEIFKALDWPR
jgi:hypothetical protein